MTYDPNPPPPLQYATPAPRAPAPRRHLLGWVLFLGLAVMLFLLLNQRSTKTNVRHFSLSEFTTRLEANEITRVVLENDDLTGDYLPQTAQTAGSPPQPFHTTLPAGTGSDWAFLQWLLANRGGADIIVRNQNNYVINILLPLVPWLLIFSMIWLLIIRPLRRNARHTTLTLTGPGRWVPDPPAKSG